MMITGKTLSRRTILRGMGTAVALPFLDAMTPAMKASPAKPPVRMAFVYVPNGIIMNGWNPASEGQLGELPRVLEHDFGQSLAVAHAAADRASEALADALDQRTARSLQPAYLGIGVEHRDSGSREHPRHGRLAHTDRAGERYTDHASNSPRSRSATSNGISGMPRIVK